MDSEHKTLVWISLIIAGAIIAGAILVGVISKDINESIKAIYQYKECKKILNKNKD